MRLTSLNCAFMKELISKVNKLLKKIKWDSLPGQESPKDPAEFLDFYARVFMRNALISIAGRRGEDDKDITLAKALAFTDTGQKMLALDIARKWLFNEFGQHKIFRRRKEFSNEMINAACKKLKREVIDNKE